MNIVELADKLGRYAEFNSSNQILFELGDCNKEDASFIIKRSNNFVIVGWATWGECDGWAFDNPEVYPTVLEALKSIEGDIEEMAYDREIIGDEEDIDYVFEPLESMPNHIRIVRAKNGKRA